MKNSKNPLKTACLQGVWKKAKDYLYNRRCGVKKLSLFLLGFIPLGLGSIISWLIMQFPHFVLPFRLIGVGFLIFWAFLGFVTYSFKEAALTSVSAVNLVAFFALILNLYQEIILGRYWGNLLGLCTQFFYLPTLNISFLLTFWSSRIWGAYIAGFFLMCSAYSIGFQIRKHQTKQAVDKIQASSFY